MREQQQRLAPLSRPAPLPFPPQPQPQQLQQHQAQLHTPTPQAQAQSQDQVPTGHIPFQVLQPHMQNCHIARNLQTKVVSLGNSLQTGLINSSEGMGGQPITPEQRAAIEKELHDSRCVPPSSAI